MPNRDGFVARFPELMPSPWSGSGRIARRTSWAVAEVVEMARKHLHAASRKGALAKDAGEKRSAKKLN
jgi:hypothetical protein